MPKTGFLLILRQKQLHYNVLWLEILYLIFFSRLYFIKDKLMMQHIQTMIMQGEEAKEGCLGKYLLAHMQQGKQRITKDQTTKNHQIGLNHSGCINLNQKPKYHNNFMKLLVALSLLLLLVSSHRLLQANRLRQNNKNKDSYVLLDFKFKAIAGAQESAMTLSVTWNGAVAYSWNFNSDSGRGQGEINRMRPIKLNLLPLEGSNTLFISVGTGVTIYEPTLSQKGCSAQTSQAQSGESQDDSGQKLTVPLSSSFLNTQVQVTVTNGCLSTVSLPPPPPPPPSNSFTLTFSAAISDFGGIFTSAQLPAPFQVRWNGQSYPQTLPSDLSAVSISIPNLIGNVGVNTLSFALQPSGGQVTSYIDIDNVVLSNGAPSVVVNGGFDSNAEWVLTASATISLNTSPGETSKWPGTQRILKLVSLGSGPQSATQSITLNASYQRV